MKTFQLNLAEVVALICCASIGIVEVTGTAQKHKASDGREYLIETEYQYNWFEALHECTRRDSQLVIIDSEKKNTVIVNLLKEVIGKSRNLWLGGNDAYSRNKDRPFFWSTTGKKFTFNNWADDEPNNGGSKEHCVHMWQATQYRWNDNECNLKMGFICENNPYIEFYNKKLTHDSDAVNKFNGSDVFIKFEHVQKANMDQINTRLQGLEQVARDGKEEMEKLNNIIDSAVQKLVDAVDKFNSDVFLKFERLQKDNMNELNTKFQTLEQMAKDGKSETQKLQIINESSVQKLSDQQELTAKNWWEKLQKQSNELNEEIKQSMQQINANFNEKLNASISSAYPVKNVVVINR